MIQLQIDGIYIDLYEQSPPKLTFTIEDIRDTSAKSIFSRTFRVPATSHNSEFFKTAFEINGLDFDITQKREARIYVDSLLFRTGQVRLQKIYLSGQNQKIDYELIFLGETKDFGTSVGEGFLNELDLSEYTHTLNNTQVITSWAAYPTSPNLNGGIFDGDILYPLIDFGVNYDSDGIPTQTRISQNNTGKHFTQSGTGNPLPVNRFKPMIRAKAVWDKIFDEAGYSYSSEFLTSNMFRKLYLSAFGNDDNNEIEFKENELEVSIESLNNQFSPLIVPFDNILLDPAGNFNTTTYKYIVPSNGLYRIRSRFYGTLGGSEFSTGTIQVELEKNSTTIFSQNYSVSGENIYEINFDSGIQTQTLTAGDTIQLRVNVIDDGFDRYNIESADLLVLEAPGDVSIAPLLDDKYKKIDFIKDIITKFRLVLIPDKEREKHFTIEPWADYIGTGSVIDWTSKLDLSKDVIYEPLFFTQKSVINFTDKGDDKDFLNVLNEDIFDETFGSLIVKSNNDYLSDERTIKTNVAPTPITQIERKNTSIGANFIIPQIHAHEPGTNASYPVQHKPIRPHSRLLFYNGVKTTSGINWYLESYGLNPLSTFPMVSYYDNYSPGSSSLNLNWQREQGYIENFTAALNGESVYERYWEGYINSLYNPFSRRMTAYFVLDYNDLYDFSFDKVIFVKNTYFYVEKIYDVPIGQKSVVKVDLIKLVDYDIDTGGFVPPQIVWNTADFKWDEASLEWNEII